MAIQRAAQNQFQQNLNGPIRWYSVLNSESFAVPPYGVVAISGADSLGFIVTSPTQDSQTAGLLINGPGVIQPGFRGQAHNIYPAIAAYQQATAAFLVDLLQTPSDDPDPEAGQHWGTQQGSFLLWAGQEGFVTVTDGLNGLVNVMPDNYVTPLDLVAMANPLTCDTAGGEALGYNSGSIYYSAGNDSGALTLLSDSVWMAGLNDEVLPTDWNMLALRNYTYLGTDSAGVVRFSDDTLHPPVGAVSPTFDLVVTYPPCSPCDALTVAGPILTGYDSITCTATQQYLVQTAADCNLTLMDPETLACCLDEDDNPIEYPPAMTANASTDGCDCEDIDDCFVMVNWSGSFTFCGCPITFTLSSDNSTTLNYAVISGDVTVSGSMTTGFTCGPPFGVTIDLDSEDLAELDIGCDTGTLTIEVPG